MTGSDVGSKDEKPTRGRFIEILKHPISVNQHGSQFTILEVSISNKRARDDPALEDCSDRENRVIKRARHAKEPSAYPFGLTSEKLKSLLRGMQHYNQCPHGCSRPICASIRRFIGSVMQHKREKGSCSCDGCKMWAWIIRCHERVCSHGAQNCHDQQKLVSCSTCPSTLGQSAIQNSGGDCRVPGCCNSGTNRLLYFGKWSSPQQKST